jgi:hypothetical protein
MARSETDKASARLRLYQSDYWAILTAATQGKNFVKTFGTHNETNAFLSRYYKFRMDLLTVGWQGAIALRDMYATGVDAEGKTFNTHKQMAQGPFTITWHYTGVPRSTIETLMQGQEPEQEPPHDYTQPGAIVQERKLDAGEAQVLKWMGKDLAAGKGAAAKTQLCPPHEGDTMKYFCRHCGLPWQDEWDAANNDKV